MMALQMADCPWQFRKGLFCELNRKMTYSEFRDLVPLPITDHSRQRAP